MILELNHQTYIELESSWLDYFDGIPDYPDFSGQYRQMLGAANSSLLPRDASDRNHDKYFTLVDVHEKEQIGLLQVVKVCERSCNEYWKVLAVRTHPKLDSRNKLNFDDEIKRHDDVTSTIAKLFASSIMLVNDKDVNASKVKILGNTQIDLSFFEALKNLISNPEVDRSLINIDHGVEVTTHNRWL